MNSYSQWTRHLFLIFISSRKILSSIITEPHLPLRGYPFHTSRGLDPPGTFPQTDSSGCLWTGVTEDHQRGSGRFVRFQPLHRGPSGEERGSVNRRRRPHPSPLPFRALRPLRTPSLLFLGVHLPPLRILDRRTEPSPTSPALSHTIVRVLPRDSKRPVGTTLPNALRSGGK